MTKRQPRHVNQMGITIVRNAVKQIRDAQLLVRFVSMTPLALAVTQVCQPFTVCPLTSGCS